MCDTRGQLAADNDDSLQAVSGDATEFEPAAGSPNSKFNKHIPVRGNEWWCLRAYMFELVEDSPYNGETPSTDR